MSHPFYRSREWQSARDAVLSENPLCVHCMAQGKLVQATEVDHIHPISKGGEGLHLDNLQPLCKPCHSKKTAVDAGRVKAKGCDANGMPLNPNKYWT